MYSQAHKSIVIYINGDECRSHEAVDYNCVKLILYMCDWIYGGNDLEYAKIKIKMARINSKTGIEMARMN